MRTSDPIYDALMSKPSIEGDECAFCGRAATNRHHVVPRSKGGHHGPTVPVCGAGNLSGCHGDLHARRLHIRWNGGWQGLRTDEPTRYMAALEMKGWRPLPWRRRR